MKILVVGSRIPWPLRDGGAIATYGLLKSLAEAGAEVTYFSYNTRKHFVSELDIRQNFPFCRVIGSYLDANPTIAGALFSLLSGRNYNISRFYSARAEKELNRLLGEVSFDVIQFEGLYATPLLNAGMPAGVPLVLRQHNVEFGIWEKLSATSPSWLKRRYFSVLARQLRRYETATLRRFDAIVPITADDEALMRQLHPSAAFHTLPVGIDTRSIRPVTQLAADQAFHIGSMEWIPNREAVHWLVREVWPLVMKQRPAARLHLAGKSLMVADPEFTAPGVTVHGEVADAATFMQEHGVMCVPVFSGGGIRVKMLEAMAMGVPVVSTSVGAAGIPVESGRHLLLADDATAFASALLRQMHDPATVREALDFVRSGYDSEVLATGLINFYKSLSLKP